MPWTKIDDQFHSHPKVIAAGSEGVALFILGLSWCGGSLTDGFIPEAQVRRLSLSDNSSVIAERLVEVGLWERRNGGYQVHDYLDYNPSAAQVKAQRAANAERQAKWRGKLEPEPEKKQGNGNNNGVSHAVIDTVTNTAPVPVPVPVPVEVPPTAEAQAPTATPVAEKAKRKNRMLPTTPQAKKMFGRVGENQRAKGRRGTTQFPTLECKKKFDAAVVILDSEFEAALTKALEQGITKITGVTNYISKWAQNMRKSQQPNHIEVKA